MSAEKSEQLLLEEIELTERFHAFVTTHAVDAIPEDHDDAKDLNKHDVAETVYSFEGRVLGRELAAMVVKRLTWCEIDQVGNIPEHDYLVSLFDTKELVGAKPVLDIYSEILDSGDFTFDSGRHETGFRPMDVDSMRQVIADLAKLEEDGLTPINKEAEAARLAESAVNFIAFAEACVTGPVGKHGEYAEAEELSDVKVGEYPIEATFKGLEVRSMRVYTYDSEWHAGENESKNGNETTAEIKFYSDADCEAEVFIVSADYDVSTGESSVHALFTDDSKAQELNSVSADKLLAEIKAMPMAQLAA